MKNLGVAQLKDEYKWGRHLACPKKQGTGKMPIPQKHQNHPAYMQHQNLKYFRRPMRFCLLTLLTALLCLIFSPALANFSNSQVKIQNPQSDPPLSPVKNGGAKIGIPRREPGIGIPRREPGNESKIEQGKLLYDAGRFAEAVQLLQQAVEEYQKQGDTLKQAVALSNLSLAYQQLGDWSHAKEAIANSLNLQSFQQQGDRRSTTPNSSTPGASSRGTRPTHWLLLTPNSLAVLAHTLEIQGRLQLKMGQAEDALQTWQLSQKVYSKTDDQSGIARSQINQAQALLTQGAYRKAVKLLNDLNIKLQSQPDSLEKTTGLRSLGDALQLAGDLENSRFALQESLKIAQRLQLKADIAASLFSLGNNARAQQQKAQAIDFYQQTVKASASPLTKVQAQLNYLGLLIEDKQSASSEILSEIQLQLNQLPPSRAAIYARINFAQSLVKLGSRETKVRSWELGVRSWELGVRSQESGVRSQESGVRSQESGVGSQEYSPPPSVPPSPPLPIPPSPPLPTSPSPPLLLATAIQQARSLGDKQAEAYGLLSLGGLYLETQQWSQAQKLTQQALLLAQASNAQEIVYRCEWQLGRLLVAQKNFKEAIAAYDAAVATLEFLRSDLILVNQDVQFSFRDSVEPVYRESVELLLGTQQTQPDAKTLEKARQRIEALQLAELDNFFREACLQGEKVPLDQVVDRDNPTAAILYPIILPQELQVIVKIPKQPLRYYTTKITPAEVEKTIAQLRQNIIKPSALKAVKTQSQQVYNWLIQPIEQDLSKSGVNTLVFVLDGPLRNLPMAALYDGKQYVVEKYAIALSLGLQLQKPKSLGREKLNALTAGLTQPPPQYPNFAPLPAIKKEIDLITEAGVSTTSLLDQQFTSIALQSKVNAAAFNIVHLATHGQFSSRADQTFILAADGPINVTQFDSLLRSRDETRLSAVELLVLSACQTAAGDNRAALGLAGAAVKAGARSTVASLWQIDDESTAQFIGAFYRELKDTKITKAQALRRAQLQLLKHPNYNSPSFWSAYVLIGNWL